MGEGAPLRYVATGGAQQAAPTQQTTNRLVGITGVILSGGASSRMGSNKALLPYRGGRFIEAIHRQLAGIFPEILVVTNTPDQYQFLPARKVPDLFPGMGALAGIHSGLHHCATPHIFAVACDMPYLDEGLIKFIAARAAGNGVVIPESDQGVEPLHAAYGREALPAIEEALAGGRRRIVSFFNRVRVAKVTREEVAQFDPTFRAFRNINTPEDYFRFRDEEKGGEDESRPAAVG
jgi:molybdopterin-guanine dinucleotide biosynthesis protein A